MSQTTNPDLTHLTRHPTKKEALVRFFLLILIVVGYFFYMAHKFGTSDGLLVTVLTWSFFVFCTPIADAGFILAFPVRLLLHVRMLYTQLAAFVIAAGLNLYTYFAMPEIYTKTVILNLFYHILSQPRPFWGIIVLSIIGTVFSIYFGDEMMDVATHADRITYQKHRSTYKIIITIFVFGATFVLYDFLLKKLGVNIPL
ncbi:MAG: hypothetical protein H6766_03180 [Candidatus Peribacteria bacterium]|nr:MAG: hypothetical protein H6766_03180 [Candidatus Peribacteria bacterium]